MFTGIISAIGTITQTTALETGLRLTIHAPALDLSDVALGDSIAHNGVCLTVISKQGDTYQVDVSRETLNCTVGLDGADGADGTGGTSGTDAPKELNLEKALRLADRLGGHLVAGHVDGVGEVIRFAPVGESHELIIRAPQALAKTIAPKGSITVNGVSLTTNRITNADFSINLIPHTMAMTTLHHLRVGSRVNLEVDLIARYVERILIASGVTPV